MDYAVLLEQIRKHIMQTYASATDIHLYYHNLNHVQEVQQAASKLSDHYQLNEEDRFIVAAAVWFHDVGYLDGIMKDHEKRSAAKAAEWLAEHKVPKELIEKISGCIMATKMPQQPTTLLEQIVADADLWQLGTDVFTEKHKLLRQEMADAHGKSFDTESWRKNNIALLKNHHYHTDFARNLLQAGQEEHLLRLEKKEQKALAESHGEMIKEKKKKSKKEDRDKADIPTRGIETMFRVTMHNHMELSNMADAKANIMISVNSIIVSVLLSVLFRRLEEYPYLIIPTILLLTVNVLTIVFSVLSVRPKIIKGKFSDQDIREKRANLLFFGNFHKMNIDQYEWGVAEMMQDKKFLYGSMTRNLYYLGVVLGRKYRLLRIAYSIFMYGFVAAVLAFSIAVLFAPR